MDIENISIKKLIPYARNPRYNADSVDKVAGSLAEYGWQQPIVVDSEMVIIAGHTRLEAAKQLGLKEVPVHIAKDLTDEQVKAYRLADNRIAQDSEWNEELLALELKELNNLSFDLDKTGFNEDELNDLLADKLEEGLTDKDYAPQLPEDNTVQEGDRYKLGEHIVMCGDATSADDVSKLLDNQLIDLVVTDPPYNVDYQSGQKTPRGARVKGWDKIENDNLTEDEFEQFVDAFMKVYHDYMKPLACIYLFHPDSKYKPKLAFLKSFNEYFTLSATLQWVKNFGGIGFQDYRSQHEPILYGWKKGEGKHFYIGDRTKTTVWSFSKGNTQEYVHPTQKPVDLLEEAINNSTRGQDIVADFFGGSGSTLIACEMTGRKARIIEKSAGYCDVIIERWQQITGKDAINMESGESYNGTKG